MVHERLRQAIQKNSGRWRLLLYGTGLPILLWILLNLIFPFKPSPAYSPLVYDREGNLLYTRLTPDEKWRLYLQPSDITPLMKKAILAKEDRWFYYHPGVNPFAIIRAGFRNIFTGKRTSGASTITMQLARLLHPRKRNIGSKVIEMFRALQLEWHFSKKEILRMYLNLAPYGGNIEGLASASYFYLDKSPDHLSLAEITALSVIPNRPNSLIPGRYNERIVAERNRWLKWMAERGFFSSKEIQDALREPFAAQRQSAPRLAPHAARLLLRKDTPVVYASLSLNAQQMAARITSDYTKGLRLMGIRNAAVLVVKNDTREIIAYVGSADFFDTTDAGQVNGARAWRQPGSTLKPIVYGLAMDAGLVTPKKIVADVPVNYRGYAPENYDLTFNGQVSMEYALMHSLNIPAVNMLQAVGKDKLVRSLVQCGFEQVGKDQGKLGLSMVLGGCGTSLEELTGLYTMLANNGVYKPLRLEADAQEHISTRILSEEASFMLHETLSKIDRPDLPVNWATTENLPRIAWKTGTSYGRRDAWSIGYNKAYTIGVWVGNFSGVSNPDLNGSSIATPLLFRLFNAFDRTSHTEWFAPPDNLDQRMVCAETGMPANDFCHQRILDYFIPLISQATPCNNRVEVPVSPNNTISYCAACLPEGGYVKKVFTVLPPDIQAFKTKQNRNPDAIPPHNPECTTVWMEKGPIIQSPRHHTEYLISKQHPEPIMLACVAESDVLMVHWYINNKHFKTATAREKIFFMPQEGMVKVSCTDDKGRNRDVRIEVRLIDL